MPRVQHPSCRNTLLSSSGMLLAMLCRACLQRVLAANRQPLYCTLRTRKRCAVLNSAGDLLRVHHILNECVIDR
jgi:hypothetical protein